MAEMIASFRCGIVLVALLASSASRAVAADDAIAVNAAVATPLPAIEQTLPHTYGVVKARSQWHLELADGRSVDLSRATSVTPIGATIRPGDRIGVFGVYSRPSVIRAAAITAIDEARNARASR